MTGGYLTLDFRDVEFKKGTDDIIGFRLGYIKGIEKYIKNTKKPIYVLFSQSVLTAIRKYCNPQDPENFTESYINPISINSIFLNDAGNNQKTFIIYKGTDGESLKTTSLCLDFTNDIVTLNEF